MISIRNRGLINRQLRTKPYLSINFDRLLGDVNLVDKKVLIIGASTGYEAHFFLRKKAREIIGIDVFEPESNFKHGRYSFVRTSGKEMPFEDSTFDVVYSQAVLEHVSDLRTVFLESLRVTKVGGLVTHMASPLWYSQEGHHRPDLFQGYPWCHVGRDMQEMILWAKNQPDLRATQDEVIEAIKYSWSLENINQAHPSAYLDAVASLKNCNVIKNDFDLDPTPLGQIPKDVLSRLPIGIESRDLLRFTHISRLIKTR